MTKLTKGANVSVSTPRLRAVLAWRPGPGVPDVDTAALLLAAAGKVRSDKDFVFYNQPGHPSGAVRHEGRRTGPDGTEESLAIDLALVDQDVERIALTASADGGAFGAVPGLALRLLDAASGATIAEFAVTDAAAETAMVAGELYRRGAQWKFRAVGQGYASGLAGLATDYGIQVDDSAAPAAPAPAPAQPAYVPPPAPVQPAPVQQAVPARPAAPSAPPVSLKKQKLISLEKRLEGQAPALLGLTKKAAVTLEKRGLGEHTARVALCLDISISMQRLYETGKIQQLAERVLALGARFDDDARIDVFLFAHDAHRADGLDPDNHTGYIRTMVERYGLQGGTMYGAAMREIRRHYFGTDETRRAPHPADLPVYVMFVTDGGTFDKDETTRQVVSSSYEPLFWQFIAISPDPRDRQFKILRKLDDMRGRHLDNADFFTVADPSQISDEELFDLMTAEYPHWLGRARAAGLIPG
ncbi:VWA domain-containing protein [Actinomadura hibisca]|uniref:VWA domain-containing protein n=1 Tax=Actinomadura hibisca TaxID=68565 RepID=UPI00082FA957|nr:VWA domain-containing protein [Actinomadura hibisca]